jgi:hypothetical protein
MQELTDDNPRNKTFVDLKPAIVEAEYLEATEPSTDFK